MISQNTLRKKLYLAIAATTLTSSTLSSHNVLAGEEWSEKAMLDEIIVTAQKRKQDLQDVPISVNVISGSKIDQQGIFTFDDLASYIPNLQINTADQITGIYLRGLGSGINTGFEQTVGLYVDGAYFGRQRHYRGALMDIDRVEVLRGPQAILFGKNTIAGAISVTSAAPTEAYESNVSVSYGSLDEVEISGAFSGPITDKVLGRVAIQSLERSSYIDNNTGDDGGQVDYKTLRGTMLFKPTDDLDITTKLEVGNFKDMGSAMQIVQGGDFTPDLLAADPGIEFGFDDTTSILGRDDGMLETDKTLYGLNFDYRMGNYTLTGITSYYDFSDEDAVDNDFSPVDMFFHYIDEDFSQFSQELRLASPVGETLEFIGGFYYQTNKLNSDQEIFANVQGFDFKPVRAFEQQTDSYSLFFMGTWNISTDLRVSSGARYVNEEKDADYGVELYFTDGTLIPQSLIDFVKNDPSLNVEIDRFSYPLDRSEDEILPMLNVQYDIVKSVMLYSSVSEGQKSGGFNAEDISGIRSRLEFDGEKSLAYEVGVESMALDNRLRVNAALFYTDFEDLQVSGLQGSSLVVGNAAEATAQGLEVDSIYKATPNWVVGASYGYLDTTYDNYEDAPLTAIQQKTTAASNDLTGEHLPYSPEHQLSLFLNHTSRLDGGLIIDTIIDTNYTDEFTTQNDNDPLDGQDGYAKVNARVSLQSEGDGWEIALVGKNLTDKTTTNYATDLPQAGSTGEAHAKFTQQPRTAALQFNWKI